MLAILVIGALAGAVMIYHAVRDIVHAIPDGNDDLIFV